MKVILVISIRSMCSPVGDDATKSIIDDHPLKLSKAIKIDCFAIANSRMIVKSKKKVNVYV